MVQVVAEILHLMPGARCSRAQALLHSSHLYSEVKNHAANYGVTVDGVNMDIGKMMAQKDKAVVGLTKGIEGLFKKNKVHSRSWGAKCMTHGALADIPSPMPSPAWLGPMTSATLCSLASLLQVLSNPRVSSEEGLAHPPTIISRDRRCHRDRWST